MRRGTLAALLIAWLRHSSLAQPAPDGVHHDPVAAPVASTPATPTPWIDLGGSPITGPSDAISDTSAPGGHPLAAALALGGIYGGFTTWTYFAWYHKHKPLSQFRWGGDGWLGSRTYAGGADKFGHAWATMGLARAGTELLSQWGGYSRLTSTLVATALSEALFIGVEVKDGFYYEFSFSDLTGDTLGALAALALSL